MRGVLSVGLALLTIGYWGCTWTGPPANDRAPPFDSWRRTIDGWESRDRWQLDEPPAALRLHPAVVAAGQLLASLLALNATSRRHEESVTRSPAGRRRGFVL